MKLNFLCLLIALSLVAISQICQAEETTPDKSEPIREAISERISQSATHAKHVEDAKEKCSWAKLNSQEYDSCLKNAESLPRRVRPAVTVETTSPNSRQTFRKSIGHARAGGRR